MNRRNLNRLLRQAVEEFPRDADLRRLKRNVNSSR